MLLGARVKQVPGACAASCTVFFSVGPVEQFLTFRAFLEKSATPPPLDPLGTLCNIYPVGQSSRVPCES
ncbi:hypothetical protein P5673_029259 [Acropora cervicornis]|uniref:Uncharacterized protein n=1 Tax=Acropora cervicornis TaxID=6130 RepID=A0AAD9PWS0_ACRCE|nr:hypothetical protein P5673_029259 [Acropora cervicornis]